MEDRLIKKRFGAIVRGLREAKGLNQEQLALAVGLARTTVTNIELGNQNCNLQTVYKLARALDVEPWDLLPGREKESQPKESALRGLVKQLLQAAEKNKEGS